MYEDSSLQSLSVSIRLLPQEAEILKAKAKEANMSQSYFLKNAILHGGAYEKSIFTMDDMEQLAYALNRIGNNFNQIKIYSHKCDENNEVEFLKLYDNICELLGAFHDFVYGIGELQTKPIKKKGSRYEKI